MPSPVMNFVDMRAAGEGLRATGRDVTLPDREGAATLGVRSEDLSVTDCPALLRGTAGIVENLGELVMAYGGDAGKAEPLIVNQPGTSLVKRGDRVTMTASPDRLDLFAADGRRLAV